MDKIIWKVNITMNIDWEDFLSQHGYIINEQANNDNPDISGVLGIMDAIKDQILKENPELEK